MSGKAVLSLPSRSPAMMTLTLFFSIMSKMLSCQQISDSFWNQLRARFIKNSTSSGARLQFQMEKAQKEATFTPNSRQQSRHLFRVRAPSWCPLKAWECFCLANLRLPSMMKAMCRGTCPFFMTAIANFQKVLSCSIRILYNDSQLLESFLIPSNESGIDAHLGWRVFLQLRIVRWWWFSVEILFDGYNLRLFKQGTSMTTWYGKSTSKQIESLLESKPKLHQLLAIPDFNQEIKSYNSKLLDYITNTPTLISEAISYLTLPPQPNDSHQRKYKLPLQTIEMIETETTCVLNAFFKEGEGGKLNIDLLFGLLDQQEILPLLGGYFFRTNLCLLNNKYKETLDRIYSRPNIFHRLIAHSEHMAISNSIQLFLNLDVNKNSLTQPQRLAIKLEVVKAILQRLADEGKKKNVDSPAIVENLCSVLIETVDKYYLIVDGKQMVEAVSDPAAMQVMIGLIQDNNEMAFPAFSFFIALINYYSFSSFTSQDSQTSSETARRNLEKLESEPMVNQMIALFGTGLDRIMNSSKMDLYHYRLLEVLCHCISISSMRIFRRICQVKFFGVLIELLFKHEQVNILHMLVEKSFYHVFISERKIYEEYKKHLFCDLDIIELTASRILRLFPEQEFLSAASKKPYFGHFMRILRIYSGIKPTDDSIIDAIKAKTNIWNKVSELLIKPYEAVSFKELGSYENVPTPITQDFSIQRQASLSPLPQNSTTIQQIEKEELYPLPHTDKKTHADKIEDSSSSHTYLFDQQPATLKMVNHLPIAREETEMSSKDSSKQTSIGAKDLKKTESYQQFINKQKKVAEEDIKNRRSLSQEKKLSSNSRGKMTSPSPNKKNSWREKDSKEEKPADRPISSTQPGIPKGPIARRAVGPATYSTSTERQNRLMKEENKSPAHSKSISLEEVRKIKVIRIDVPKEKKYRRAGQKDQVLLQFLGLSM